MTSVTVVVLSGSSENTADAGLLTGDAPRSCLRLRGRSLLYYQLKGVLARLGENSKPCKILLLSPSESGVKSLRAAVAEDLAEDLGKDLGLTVDFAKTPSDGIQGALDALDATQEEPGKWLLVAGDSLGTAPVERMLAAVTADGGSDVAIAYTPATWSKGEAPVDAICFAAADGDHVVGVSDKDGKMVLTEGALKGVLTVKSGFNGGCVAVSTAALRVLKSAGSPVRDIRRLLSVAAGERLKVQAVATDKPAFTRLLKTTAQYKDLTMLLCQSSQTRHLDFALEAVAKGPGKEVYLEDGAIELPDTSAKKTFIARNVRVGKNVTIAQSVICEGAEIGDDCSINNSLLGAHCRVLPGVNLSACSIEPRAEVAESAKKLTILC